MQIFAINLKQHTHSLRHQKATQKNEYDAAIVINNDDTL